MALATFGYASSGAVIVLGILALLVCGFGQIFFTELLVPYTITIAFLLVWLTFDKGHSGWH
jgi:hypothetical protein